MGAELNFYLEDYEPELRRLMELSEPELVTMLRKQSAGEGSLLPEYPPVAEPQETLRETAGPSNYSTVREKLDEVEATTAHKRQLDSKLVPKCLKANALCSTLVRAMVQSENPQGESTLRVPQAAHVYKRSGQYIQVVDNMTATFRS
ncbi:unnamed protein product [Calypogeia fissa]